MNTKLNPTNPLSCLLALLLLICSGISEAENHQLNDTKNSSSFTVSEFAKALKQRESEKHRSSSSTPQSQRPDQLSLNGSLRNTDLSSALGRVNLRWTRDSEALFSSTPDRLVAEAMKAAARVLSRPAFPSRLKQASFDWRIVFMNNAKSPSSIGPGQCHPAWMTPPADLFIDAKTVASLCNTEKLNPSEASAQLLQTLVHELGHAIEFQLADKGFPLVVRWHAEGFASWFETLASEALIGQNKIIARPEMRIRAKNALNSEWRPNMFQGSSDDYARAYGLIAVIAEDHSIAKLVDVYERMSKDTIGFEQAVERELGWNSKTWVARAVKYLK